MFLVAQQLRVEMAFLDYTLGVEALVGQCPARDDAMRATGKVLVSASLGDLEHWRTLLPSGGNTRIIDGPYTESKEVVGGMFIIEADNAEEAQRIGLVMAAIYRATLDEIALDGPGKVLNQRLSLSPGRKLWLAWKTWTFGYKP